MKNTIKYERGKFLIEEINGKHIKRMRIDIHKFYDMWYEKIASAETVADFDYRFEEQKVHIKWLNLTTWGGEICERTFYLDESVTNRPFALKIFSQLAQDFRSRKEHYLDYLSNTMERLTMKYGMEQLVSKIMREYTKKWSLDSIDKKSLFDMVKWVEENGYEKGNLWLTPIEKSVFFVLIGYMTHSVANIIPKPIIEFFTSGTVKETTLSTSFMCICVFLVLIKFIILYSDACNERSMNDLLDEFEEKFGKEYEIFKKSGKTIEDLRIIVEDIFDHVKEHAAYLGDQKEQDVAQREESMLSNSVFNLKERFDHMRGIIEIERELYKGNNIGGYKSYINGNLSSEDLIRRLTYIDYKGEELHLKDIFDVLFSIEQNPYFGCEEDILDLYELAIENVYLATKYRPQVYDVTSEYETYLKRKREVFERIADHQEMASKYAYFLAAPETRGSIKFKPVI